MKIRDDEEKARDEEPRYRYQVEARRKNLCVSPVEEEERREGECRYSIRGPRKTVRRGATEPVGSTVAIIRIIDAS